MLNIAGMQLKTLTAYNEYITDIIIASSLLELFAMIIKMLQQQTEKKEEKRVCIEGRRR